MAKLRSLWFGELSLGEAFWTWAISIGLLVNLMTSVLFLIMISLDGPWAALLFGYVPSCPKRRRLRSIPRDTPVSMPG